MADSWSGISLTAGASTGDLKQLFPTWFGTGDATNNTGDLKRKAVEGTLFYAQVETDSTNGGVIEIWDLNGEEAGANINTADAVTNAQLVTLQGRGRAKLLWSQDFTASAGATTASGFSIPVMFGLAARFVGAAGTCSLNMKVSGCARKQPISG